MATKTIVLTLCDFPHEEDTEGFPVTVTSPDGTWDVDVCPTHAAPLLDIVAAGRIQKRNHTRKVLRP